MSDAADGTPTGVSDIAPYGTHDGEIVNGVAVKFSGVAVVDKTYKEGDTVFFTIQGKVGVPAYRRTTSGHLIRQHAVKLEQVAEPGEQLVDEVVDFMKRMDDLRENKQALPFDQATDGDDTPTP